jgi:predicted nucleic acid-binding protein
MTTRRNSFAAGQPTFQLGSKWELTLRSQTLVWKKLQRGEQAAILLAESIKADMIVLDEKSARRVATDRGLRVTGTLGLLGEAATRGLVDLPPAIERLTKTSFRYSPALLKATLDRFGNR